MENNELVVCGIRRIIKPLSSKEIVVANQHARRVMFGHQIGQPLQAWASLLQRCTRPRLTNDEINGLDVAGMGKIIKKVCEVTLQHDPELKCNLDKIELDCSPYSDLSRMEAKLNRSIERPFSKVEVQSGGEI